MKKSIIPALFLAALSGCAYYAPPQPMDFILPLPHPSDELPARPHSNNPMQLFFGIDGSAIRLPDNRATRVRREGDMIVLE